MKHFIKKKKCRNNFLCYLHQEQSPFATSPKASDLALALEENSNRPQPLHATFAPLKPQSKIITDSSTKLKKKINIYRLFSTSASCTESWIWTPPKLTRLRSWARSSCTDKTAWSISGRPGGRQTRRRPSRWTSCWQPSTRTESRPTLKGRGKCWGNSSRYRCCCFRCIYRSLPLSCF